MGNVSMIDGHIDELFDKYKTCKNCPDRSVDPPCHDNCDGYKARCEKQAEINRNRRASKNVPTAHREKVSFDYYKRQKKQKIYLR